MNPTPRLPFKTQRGWALIDRNGRVAMVGTKGQRMQLLEMRRPREKVVACKIVPA